MCWHPFVGNCFVKVKVNTRMSDMYYRTSIYSLVVHYIYSDSHCHYINAVSLSLWQYFVGRQCFNKVLTLCYFVVCLWGCSSTTLTLERHLVVILKMHLRTFFTFLTRTNCFYKTETPSHHTNNSQYHIYLFQQKQRLEYYFSRVAT